ncbi:hypothetical protein PFAG_04208 [Plasmodium falciparum Santa Lucia]|uniref:Plasmodium RESA N-terminal domain-containing protein n=11 Tax=Plasmodium falciparum TaxID=5833 RepID=A0A024W2G8_PLAFA|nr:hypothetical protein PFFVO_03818 [Plasmodium falciparum Vietnam Oak-Knoll (FVO)]ETW29733.1 hypothetical protein PFFCH_02834 [Plasmodium falciparum FCH/4]ETW35129.1 hypothetical protein PFTANZ_04177 [Plasmodium falciparum Tanzania (2000708)]ETW41381.1 hypothetical protein PFNF135_04367 [Plasmodium falciparum NF135/5.C10]ETW47891.1 hypothetical protein PFMALIP_04079 [Plasmodium falciparum MaliPS096_E11]ETW55785.1 hypothetical protein PFUGPA_02229 [Plasmodium falciparum Palo Alto/Uganda]ETW60
MFYYLKKISFPLALSMLVLTQYSNHEKPNTKICNQLNNMSLRNFRTLVELQSDILSMYVELEDENDAQDDLYDKIKNIYNNDDEEINREFRSWLQKYMEVTRELKEKFSQNVE